MLAGGRVGVVEGESDQQRTSEGTNRNGFHAHSIIACTFLLCSFTHWTFSSLAPEKCVSIRMLILTCTRSKSATEKLVPSARIYYSTCVSTFTCKKKTWIKPDYGDAWTFKNLANMAWRFWLSHEVVLELVALNCRCKLQTCPGNTLLAFMWHWT